MPVTRRSQRKLPWVASRPVPATPPTINLSTPERPPPSPLRDVSANAVRPSPLAAKMTAPHNLLDDADIEITDMTQDLAPPPAPAPNLSLPLPESRKRKSAAVQHYRPSPRVPSIPLSQPVPSSSGLPAIPSLIPSDSDYDSDSSDDDSDDGRPRRLKPPKLPNLQQYPDQDEFSGVLDKHIGRNDKSAAPDFSELLASIPLDDAAPVGTRRRRLVRKKDLEDEADQAPADEEEIKSDTLLIEEAAQRLGCRKRLVKTIRKEEIVQTDERGEAISAAVVADVPSEDEGDEEDEEDVLEEPVKPEVPVVKPEKPKKQKEKGAGLLGLLDDSSDGDEDELMQLRRPEPTRPRRKFKRPPEIISPRDKDDGMEWVNGDQLGKKNDKSRKQFRDIVEERTLWRVPGMSTALLPHQVLGVDWMVQREYSERPPHGGLVADAMGLGKTIQAIATMVMNPPLPDEETGKLDAQVTLIVAPVALLRQWKDEIMAHTKRNVFNVRIHHGNDKIRTLKELKKQDVVLTTYGALMKSYPNPKPPRRMNDEDRLVWWEEQWKGRGMFHRMKFWRVVLDECHIIKNRRTRTSLACQELDTKYAWAMSGTPIQNGLDDIFPIFRFVEHPHAGIYGNFKNMMSGDMGSKAQRVQAVLRGCMMRRNKTDFLLGKPLITLPKKFIRMVELEFGTEERNLYMAVEARIREKINKFIRKGTLLKNYTNILTMLLRLRQICNHPYLILQAINDGFSVEDLENALEGAEDDDATADGPGGNPLNMREFVRAGSQQNQSGLRKILEAAKSQVKVFGDEKECAICFDVWEDAVMGNCRHGFCRACIESHLTKRAQEGKEGNCPMCTQPVKNKDLKTVHDENISDVDDNADWLEACGDFMPSAKTLAMRDQIAEWREQHPEDSLVLFSQFTKMLDIVDKVCEDEGWPTLRYQGDMNISEREEALEQFRNSHEPQILLMSLKAGGVGLNLVKANLCLSLDLWWNAASEMQAFDRVHRLGQQKEVFITRFVIKNSVEERILALQKEKLKIADAALGEGEGKLGKLSIHELVGLFGRVVHDNQGGHLEADYDADLLRRRAREVMDQRRARLNAIVAGS